VLKHYEKNTSSEMVRKLNTEDIQRINIEEFKRAKKIPMVVILNNVRSMHNVGSVFRTADGFCVEKVLLCGITAIPPNAEIHKSALGAEFSVNWEYFKETTDALKMLVDEDYTPIAVEQADKTILLNDFKFDKSKKYALVFGNEVSGVQQEVIDLCRYCIELPQFGTKHSLNVSVAAGITIWEFWKNLC
jgi:tRNA G18 (ribose-2'-O)-methylase SpoU